MYEKSLGDEKMIGTGDLWDTDTNPTNNGNTAANKDDPTDNNGNTANGDTPNIGDRVTAAEGTNLEQLRRGDVTGLIGEDVRGWVEKTCERLQEMYAKKKGEEMDGYVKYMFPGKS